MASRFSGLSLRAAKRWGMAFSGFCLWHKSSAFLRLSENDKHQIDNLYQFPKSVLTFFVIFEKPLLHLFQAMPPFQDANSFYRYKGILAEEKEVWWQWSSMPQGVPRMLIHDMGVGRGSCWRLNFFFYLWLITVFRGKVVDINPKCNKFSPFPCILGCSGGQKCVISTVIHFTIYTIEYSVPIYHSKQCRDRNLSFAMVCSVFQHRLFEQY